MALYDKSQYPYYDDYDSRKHYTHLLAVPGRVAQAREITQIQSTVKDIVKSVGDSFFRDGSVIEGCQIIISSDKKSVTITPGKLYINGMVLPLDEVKDIPINGTGEETIGVRLVENLITEENDDSLRDKAQGFGNFNQPGCHRIESKLEVVVNTTEDCTILETLIDGDIVTKSSVNDIIVTSQTLARRTYDESGSYIVNGLSVSLESLYDSNVIIEGTPRPESDNFRVVVSPGKAYVRGYEVELLSPYSVIVPRSLTTRSIDRGESFDYYTGISEHELDKNPYIKDITKVVGKVLRSINNATVSTNTSTASIGGITGSGNVYKVYQIKDGVETVFTKNTDYRAYMTSNNLNIQWLGTSNWPGEGRSFSVDYLEDYEFKNKKDDPTDYDYELITKLVDSQYSHYLKWNTDSDTLPLDTKYLQDNYNTSDRSDFSVVYDCYLARKDLVYIDGDGNISVLQGNPDWAGDESAPELPAHTMALAQISCPPGGTVSGINNNYITVSNVGLTRFTMSDIQKLINRIKTLEYNQVALSLNDEARNTETDNMKKGIFTDPLIDYSKIDLYVASPEDPSKKYFDATLDLIGNTCYLPGVATTHDLYMDKSGAVSNTIKSNKRSFTLPTTSENLLLLSQDKASGTIQVNPYSVFPQLPEISLTPASDIWVENKYVTKPATSSEVTEVVETTNRTTETNITQGRARPSTQTTSYEDTPTGSRVEVSTTTTVLEEAISYIRPRVLKVEGSFFDPECEIVLTFDSKNVLLVPTGDTKVGSLVVENPAEKEPIAFTQKDPDTGETYDTVDWKSITGSVKPDSEGRFTAMFGIPKDIPTGTKEVVAKGNSLRTNVYSNSAVASYDTSGVLKTTTSVDHTLTTILVNRVITTHTTNYVDPVGQTFILRNKALINSVDLYFAAKPTVNTPVTCDLREVVNGMITSNVLAHKTLNASEVIVDSDGKGNKATTFVFEDPYLLEAHKEYAFVVRSASDRYMLWSAELGKPDVVSGDTILRNPYMDGVMMSSSNNLSWTVHQTTDLKFKLNGLKYHDRAEVYFREIETSENFNRVCLRSETILPESTSIQWMYSLDGGSTYQTIDNYRVKLLGNNSSKRIRFKAILSSTDPNMTPMLVSDTITVVLTRYDSVGYYVSKNIMDLDEYSSVDVIMDTYLPDSSCKMSVILDNGTKSITITDPKDPQKLKNNGWKESTYSATMTPTIDPISRTYNLRVIIKMEGTIYSTPEFRRLRVIIS